MGGALIPSLGPTGRMQRVGEEHQAAVLMFGGDQRRNPAAERMPTDGCFAGRRSRGEIDGHGGLGTTLGQLDGGRFDAAPPQAGNLRREASGAA